LYSDSSVRSVSVEFDEGLLMARKPSPITKDAKPPRVDDLKLINGIGPGVEKRLNGVSIFTFAQLAAMSPADIAAVIAGLSAERIIKEDWIGQARRLATDSMSAEPQPVTETPVEPQRHTTFTLELLLDEDNNVRRSRIMHIESGEEDTWDNWQDRRLVEFFVQRAGLNIPRLEPAASDVAAKEPVSPVAAEPAIAVPIAEAIEPAPPVVTPPSAKEAEITPPLVPMTVPVGRVPHLRRMEIVSAEAPGPQKLLRSGQPFDVRLTLDLSDVEALENTQLSYKVSIYGKSVEGHPRLAVGETSGIITPADSVRIDVRGTTPPEGIYRLQTVVTLKPTTIEPTAPAELRAMTESKLLLVF
jgi:predicted flap endonuclease-1-like 5' DNA nuclease